MLSVSHKLPSVHSMVCFYSYMLLSHNYHDAPPKERPVEAIFPFKGFMPRPLMQAHAW